MSELISEELIARERTLAQESFSSACFSSGTSFYIDFPQNVEGMTILDIGAGASPNILELQKRGARAIALDFRYNRLYILKRSVNKSLLGNDPITRLNRERKEKSFQEVRAEMPLGANPMLWRLATQMAKKVQEAGNIDYVKRCKEAEELFFRSHRRREVRAVAALAGALPFRDETFDFCYSLQCISKFLIGDREVLLQAASEALRVLKPGEGLKPGGQLQIHPWVGPNFEWSNTEKDNAKALLQDLNDKKVPYFIESLGIQSSPRLRIIKP